KKQKGGLRLDTKASTLQGGDTGPALVPGKPEESLLIKAVSSRDPDLQMPPTNRLAPQEVAALKQWVALGAPDPRTNTPTAQSAIRNPQSAIRHWAYQPVQ